MARSLLLLLLFAVTAITACRKDVRSDKPIECQQLIIGMQNNDEEAVKTVINQFIDRLPSRFYSKENISKLAEAMENECNLMVTADCFDCIKTIPSQTEVMITVFQPGGNIRRYVDISYTTSHKMIVGHVHD